MTTTTQLALFDYANLDTETRIVVQQRTIEIKALMKRAASDIIEIGQKLIEVKMKLGHGHFGGWLKSEFDWSQDTAQNFINVASKFGKFPNLDGIAPSALYLLAAPSVPESARQEATIQAETGKTVTYTEAKRIVAGHVIAQTPARTTEKIVQRAPELFEKIQAGDITISEAQRELKERDREQVREQNRALVANTPPMTQPVVVLCSKSTRLSETHRLRRAFYK